MPPQITCFCTTWQNEETQKLHFHSNAVGLLVHRQNSTSHCFISSVGGKTKHHLISYFLSYNSAKNYRNRIVVYVLQQVKSETFFETQTPQCTYSRNCCMSRSFFCQS